MISGKYIAVLLCSIQLSCISSGLSVSSADINIVIPGISAEGYRIGSSIETNEDLSITPYPGNIKEITKIETFKHLNFDSFINIPGRAVLFIDNKTIVAIAGMKSERRITGDAVKLSNGTKSFIENYGYSGLETFSINYNRVYIYKDYGIALFDDNSDDTIDMYLVFNK